jgi:GMP synthase (glutamine-hydrolysing)
MQHDHILILDFGSQVTQLIARRVRENGVYCEIWPFNDASENRIKDYAPKAIILSGGPCSVTEPDSPRAPECVFDMNIPLLGICYGQQVMVEQLGGKVESGHHREFGRADIEVLKNSPLFGTVWTEGSTPTVWMSHGDRVTNIPEGFKIIAKSSGAPCAIIADEQRQFYGIQFHPEVMHTQNGTDIIRNFIIDIAGCSGDWTMAAYKDEAIEKIRKQVGNDKVICGLSGGVDSSVAAILIHEAIGDQLTCIYVNTGTMRKGESEQVVQLFRDHYNIPLIHEDASDLFLGKLAGVDDPERKRKIIGNTFIDVFDDCAKRVGGAKWLAQGTLYPDVIESV